MERTATGVSKGTQFGKVVQVIGPTVDVQVDGEDLPEIYNALRVVDEKHGIDLTLEVALHLGDNIIRCIADRSGFSLRRSAIVLP